MLKCETAGELITNQELTSPVEVTSPDVRFEHCRFVVADPQHTLLTTGERTQVHDCEFQGDYHTGCSHSVVQQAIARVKTLLSLLDLSDPAI